MSKTAIHDNWINKPINSLGEVYSAWLPQTSASLEDRITALKVLTKRFPDIGWQICIDQLQTGFGIGGTSHRPRWRSDASGAGRSISKGEEIYEFTRNSLDLVLAWPEHNQKTLGDLVERLPNMPEKDQNMVWDLIDTWTDSEIKEEPKADLREQIRSLAFTRRGRLHWPRETNNDRAHLAYEKLAPKNPIVHHSWLFAQHWIEPSSDEIGDENFDYRKFEEKIRMLRADAMREIWEECGFEGVKALLPRSEAPYAVGESLGGIISQDARSDCILQFLSITTELEIKADGCIQGFLMSVGEGAIGALLFDVCELIDPNRRARLFRCAPFRQDTWRQLDQYDEITRKGYWQEVHPPLKTFSEAELIEIIDRLLEAKRPRAALHTVRLDFPQIETSRLKRLLHDVVTVNAEPADGYRIDVYHISKALESLDGRNGVGPDEMAQFEFMFISFLEHSKYGIPNLERQIAKSPLIFLQALAFAFKRKDGVEDPPELRTHSGHSELASAAYSLLCRIACIPGTNDGKIKAEALLEWIIEVRRLCAQHGRVEIGDQQIGQLLSNAPAEEDGSWPCHPVCEAMEKIGSQQIGLGFQVGVFNGRGVHSRGLFEGGAQERDLAAKYRGWARQRAFDHPYVSSVLERIAADYDQQGRREDIEVEIQKRIGHRP